MVEGGGAEMSDVSLRQRLVVFVLAALLSTSIVIAAAGVFCPISGKANFREFLFHALG
jgi:hypothetical protein